MIHKDEVDAMLRMPQSQQKTTRVRRAVERLRETAADYKRFGVNLPALIESIERDIKRLTASIA